MLRNSDERKQSGVFSVLYIFSVVYFLWFYDVKLASWENDSCKWFNYFSPKLNIKIKSIFWVSLSFLPIWCTVQGRDFTPGVMLWTITHGFSSILTNFISGSPQQKMSHTGLKKPRLKWRQMRRIRNLSHSKIVNRNFRFYTIFKGLCKMQLTVTHRCALSDAHKNAA